MGTGISESRATVSSMACSSRVALGGRRDSNIGASLAEGDTGTVTGLMLLDDEVGCRRNQADVLYTGLVQGSENAGQGNVISHFVHRTGIFLCGCHSRFQTDISRRPRVKHQFGFDGIGHDVGSPDVGMVRQRDDFFRIQAGLDCGQYIFRWDAVAGGRQDMDGDVTGKRFRQSGIMGNGQDNGIFRQECPGFFGWVIQRKLWGIHTGVQYVGVCIQGMKNIGAVRSGCRITFRRHLCATAKAFIILIYGVNRWQGVGVAGVNQMTQDTTVGGNMVEVIAGCIGQH
nr:MAG TPA: hypothetical protein [Caudoviricetes sp.]